MKTLASVSIACCLGLAAAGVAAQDEGRTETNDGSGLQDLHGRGREGRQDEKRGQGQGVQGLGRQSRRSAEEVGRSFPVERLARDTASRFYVTAL